MSFYVRAILLIREMIMLSKARSLKRAFIRGIVIRYIDSENADPSLLEILHFLDLPSRRVHDVSLIEQFSTGSVPVAVDREMREPVRYRNQKRASPKRFRDILRSEISTA
jgi:hypothetical protein